MAPSRERKHTRISRSLVRLSQRHPCAGTLGEYNDEALLEALDKARRAFDQQGKDLDTDVGDSGGSLSVGQRQLLCFARAVLRGSKTSPDERTANVVVTLLQSMVRWIFASIFTIARLATVIDYDKIAVLICWWSTACQTLLRDLSGRLALVEQTGPTMAPEAGGGCRRREGRALGERLACNTSFVTTFVAHKSTLSDKGKQSTSKSASMTSLLQYPRSYRALLVYQCILP